MFKLLISVLHSEAFYLKVRTKTEAQADSTVVKAKGR